MIYFNDVNNLNELKSRFRQLAFKLNNFLPKDIVIFDLFEVSPDLHARFDAESRTYKYYI